MHVGIADPNVRVDFVPVDYVCNALIASTWDTAMIGKRHHGAISVYNYVSGNENPVTFEQVVDRLIMMSRLYPLHSSVYYPSVFWTKSRRVFSLMEFFVHLIPALMIDTVARLLGKQPGLYKLAREIGDASRALMHFSTHQWDFENQQTQKLWNRMGPTDQRTFPFNMRNVDWDEHTLKMVKGFRKYIIGEPDGNEEQARQRHVYLYILHTIVRLALGILILWLIWMPFH